MHQETFTHWLKTSLEVNIFLLLVHRSVAEKSASIESPQRPATPSLVVIAPVLVRRRTDRRSGRERTPEGFSRRPGAAARPPTAARRRPTPPAVARPCACRCLRFGGNARGPSRPGGREGGERAGPHRSGADHNDGPPRREGRYSQVLSKAQFTRRWRFLQARGGSCR